MKTYLCQMIGMDNKNVWAEIAAYDPRSAARTYAENCDDSSGGEMFDKPDSEHVVLVKDHGKFTIGVEFVKSYYTKDG